MARTRCKCYCYSLFCLTKGIVGVRWPTCVCVCMCLAGCGVYCYVGCSCDEEAGAEQRREACALLHDGYPNFQRGEEPRLLHKHPRIFSLVSPCLWTLTGLVWCACPYSQLNPNLTLAVLITSPKHQQKHSF